MEYQNILIIKMSSMGDVIHALPTAAALRQRFPQARITWLVHPQFGGFVPEPPIIDEVIYFDKVAFGKKSLKQKIVTLRKLRIQLHSYNFDLVIDLQGLFKSAVMAYLTGCSNRIGYSFMREGSSLVSKSIVGPHKDAHVIERYLDVARHLGADVQSVDFPLPSFDRELGKMRQLLHTEGIPYVTRGKKEGVPVWGGKEDKLLAPYVVFAPGARWETKVWPVEHYAKLARKIIKAGYYVVLVGGKDDAELGKLIRQIANYAPELIDVLGKTSLREVAAIIQDSDFYISGDTGPLHMANALKKPLIALFGPTKADRTGPYGSPYSMVMLSPAKCRGCLKKHCKDWHCMHDLTPDKVFQVFQEEMRAYND